jgi:hypothetical protein
MEVIVEQVGGQGREIECELGRVSSLACETKNQAMWALFLVWAAKIKVRCDIN